MKKEVLNSVVINNHKLDGNIIKLHFHPKNSKDVLLKMNEKTTGETFRIVEGLDFKDKISFILIKLNGGFSHEYEKLHFNLMIAGGVRSDPLDYLTVNKYLPWLCYKNKTFNDQINNFLKEMVKGDDLSDIIFYPLKTDSKDSQCKVYPDSTMDMLIYGIKYIESIDVYLF